MTLRPSHAAPTLEDQVRLLAESPHRATLILDYDGTLAPLRPRPELAKPDPELLDLLARLADAFRVHVVSGRPRQTLEEWLGHLPLGLHGEHGLWSRMPGEGWEPNADIPSAWMDEAEPLLQAACAGFPGSFVERKERSLAWHHRLVADDRQGDQAAAALAARMAALPTMAGIEAIHGHKVIEFRTKGVHKGLVVPRIVRPGHPVLAAGDDRTDEDLFRCLPPRAILVKVGDGATLAPHRLPSPAAFRRLLASALSSATP